MTITATAYGRSGLGRPRIVIDGVVVDSADVCIPPPASPSVVTVSPSGAPSAASEPRSPAESRFGFGIACLPSCTRARASDGTDYWKFDGHPPIVGVRPGGPAAMAGLRVGDVVTEVDGLSILTEEGALRFQRSGGRRSIDVSVLRDGKRVEYSLR